MNKTRKISIISAAIASVFLLSACSKQGQKEQTNMAEKTASVDIIKGPAELGSFGVELDARDESIKPGDDFFKYAGGTWYKNFDMPSDKTRYGAFDKLAERSETQIKQLVEEISQGSNLNPQQQMVADFYTAYMDVDSINAKGISPIASVLEKIRNIENKSSLTAAFGNAWLDGSISPIRGGLGFNRLDPDEYQMSIGVSGLGLPDRSYYLEDSERFVNIRIAYVAHITQMLNL